MVTVASMVAGMVLAWIGGRALYGALLLLLGAADARWRK